jgi:hypothetical protein
MKMGIGQVLAGIAGCSSVKMQLFEEKQTNNLVLRKRGLLS